MQLSHRLLRTCLVASTAALLVHCNGSTDSTSSTGGAGASGAAASTGGARASGGAGPVGAAGGSTSAAGQDSGLQGTRDQFCAGTGAVVSVPSGGGTICTGDLGKETFLYAVCSCQNIAFSGALVTDSFNSKAMTKGLKGASVGTNGSLALSGNVSIGGSLLCEGTGDTSAISLVGGGNVYGDVRAGASTTASDLAVHADAFVNGSFLGIGNTVTGTLYTPAGASHVGVTAGAVVEQPVTVAPPCNCDNPVDIKAIVTSFATQNDDAASMIAPNLLENRTSTAPIVVELDCGRYYFTKITGAAPLVLKMKGRTAIFVDGDISWSGGITLDLGDTGELDMFVSGNFSLAGDQTFGLVNAPARVRIYDGGDNVSISGDVKMGANLYAPHAQLSAASHTFEASGSLFVKSLALAGDLTVHYDEAVLELDGCKKPMAQCTQGTDCVNPTPACVTNTCVPCTTDDQCQTPLFCSGGQCVPQSPIIH